MRAGLLTEEVTFLQPIKTTDDYGSLAITSYTPLFTTKANVKFMNGQREVQNQEIVWDVALQVKVRSYHQIDNDYLVEYDNVKYYIVSIDRTQKDVTTLILHKYDD